jgi:tetratricopeptide (TPR) repeat protein
MSLPNQAAAQPQGVEAYFTDVEHLRSAFKDAILAPALARRLLIVHGVGGAGKSSLLQMFRLDCKRNKIPVALASGDESKSVVDIFYRKAEAGDERGWAPDLKADGVTLPAFTKTWEHYRAIQAKVEAQVRKEASVRAAEIAGKAASKTAEAAAGAAFGAALGSLAPGIGTAAGAALGGVVGGMGAEAFVDWLRSSLNLGKPDIDLLLDPAKALSEDFLADIAKAAAMKRIVLMLDTYEQLTALDDWAREFAQRLHPNVLLVIAGRAVPDWQRQWPGWLAQAQVEEVKPMTDEVMRELAVRYYRTLRGSEPDPMQVDAIVRFARGLPVVVTSAINIWVEYGVEDFQSVKSQVVADLVDRLMEGVPAEMAPLLEAAAAVRWFNKEILRAVTQMPDVNAAYNELRRFPFARPRAEGFMLHDTVREMIDANLKVEDPERYRELHERAAAYFEARLAKVSGEEAERLALERLYHRVCASTEDGLRTFQEMAEEFTQYRLVIRLQALLSDVSTFAVNHDNFQLWTQYYLGRLAILETRTHDAAEIFQQVAENERAEKRLRAYSYGDWGWTLCRREILRRPGGEQNAIRALNASLNMGIPIDSKLATSWIYLSDVFVAKAAWNEAQRYLDEAVQYLIQSEDFFRLLEAYEYACGIYSRQGNWPKVCEYYAMIRKVFADLGSPSYLVRRVVPPWEWILMGRLSEYEHGVRAALGFARTMQDHDWLVAKIRDLALCMALQERVGEAEIAAMEAHDSAHRWRQIGRLQMFETAGITGYIESRSGDTQNGGQILRDAINAGMEFHAHLHMVPVFLAATYEVTGNLDGAVEYYVLAYSEASKIDRNYVRASALTGLFRCCGRQQIYDRAISYFSEAEQLAQQYEYNDHLASLRLTQGHIAWDGRLDAWGVGFDAALHHYQHALVYALRFNRFLLDEALAGRPQGTPLQPILPTCLARGEEGRRMLIALADWWQTGVNDVGVPRPDTISPLPEGIPLLEAERIAREREPGDGSPQTPVLARLAAVLEP